MNKKIIIGILIGIFAIVLTGCSLKKEENMSSNNPNEVITNSNSAVIYFSATGTTKNVASKIASLSGSDIIEIIPKEKYTSKDLDYNNDCRANKEQNDSKSRPEIENEIDITKYDTIYLGYPIWWGTNPRIILTFLDKYDLTGKTIILFCTSGSSSIDKSISDLKSYNTNLNIKDGKRFSLSDSDGVILEFINKNKQKDVVSSMKAIINDKEYIINLESNETVNTFLNMLPKEFTMNDLNNNEKYVYLDNSLPSNDIEVKRVESGDIMLFNNNCLVIFYKSFDTTYSYTKLGHIDNLPDLGNGSVSVKFEK